MTDIAREGRGSGFGSFILFWIIGPLLALAIGIAAIVVHPPDTLLLDTLKKQFRNRTGYDLTYGPGSTIVLWPQAMLDLREIKITRPAIAPAIGGLIAEAKRVTVRLDTKSWLKGNRTIDTASVTEPALTLQPADIRRLKVAKSSSVSGFLLHRLDIKEGYVNYQPGTEDPEFSIGSISGTLTDLSANSIRSFQSSFNWRDAMVRLKGDIARKDVNTSKLNFAMTAPSANVDFKGSVYSDATTRVEGDADIRIKSGNDFLHWLNVGTRKDIPALTGAATIKGPIAVSKRQIWLKGADISSSIAEGKVDVALDLRNERPRITGEAAWTRFDADALTIMQPTGAALAVRTRRTEPVITYLSAWEGLDDYLDSLNQPRLRSIGVAPRQASDTPPLPAKTPRKTLLGRLDALRWGDIKLSQTLKALTVANLHFADVIVDSELDVGRIDLDVKKAKIAGGTWKAHLKIDSRTAQPNHELEISGDNVEAGPVLQHILGRIPVDGRADFAADISARGSDTSALIKSATGNAEVVLQRGKIFGFDLRAVLNQWWRKWRYDRNCTTPFERIKARFRVRKGIVNTIGAASLRGSHVELDTTGSISLADQKLNQRLRARLAPPPSQLPIPVRVSGSWNAPKVRLDFPLFSSEPNNYELPLTPNMQLTRARSFGLSAAPTAVEEMPDQLREKIQQALNDPTKVDKMPLQLRQVLTGLANSPKVAAARQAGVRSRGCSGR